MLSSHLEAVFPVFPLHDFLFYFLYPPVMKLGLVEGYVGILFLFFVLH